MSTGDHDLGGIKSADGWPLQDIANRYIEDILRPLESAELSPEDAKIVSNRGAAIFILSKLMRRNFRRRVGIDTMRSIKEKVVASVKDRRPIHLVIPFCGNKHYWTTAYPEPDWAELFHLHFMANNLSPILAVHEPGVVIEYISQDLILPRLDNYPEDALDAYAAGFRKLLIHFQAFLPSNFKVRFFRLAERCNGRALVNEVERRWPERVQWFASLNNEDKERQLARSRRSVMWNGKQDLSGLSTQKKYERIVESRLIELTFLEVERDLEYLGDYFNEDNRIRLVFSYGMSPDNYEWGELTLHTAYGSGVDFWTGRGILRLTSNDPSDTVEGVTKTGDWRVHGTIVSRSQYETVRDKLVSLPVDQPLIDQTNFGLIEVLSTY